MNATARGWRRASRALPLAMLVAASASIAAGPPSSPGARLAPAPGPGPADPTLPARHARSADDRPARALPFGSGFESRRAGDGSGCAGPPATRPPVGRAWGSPPIARTGERSPLHLGEER